jgi:hypothetical protein
LTLFWLRSYNHRFAIIKILSTNVSEECE